MLRQEYILGVIAGMFLLPLAGKLQIMNRHIMRDMRPYCARPYYPFCLFAFFPFMKPLSGTTGAKAPSKRHFIVQIVITAARAGTATRAATALVPAATRATTIIIAAA